MRMIEKLNAERRCSKSFRVGILFCEENESHNGVALDIFERLKVPSLHGGLYSPALISSRFDERDFRLNMLNIMNNKYDLLVSIGDYFTTLTIGIYKELGVVVPTVFAAVTDPVALGFVKSLEHPEGYTSGIIFEPEPALAYARNIALLYSPGASILVPYGPDSALGLLEKRARELSGALQLVGLVPILAPINSLEEALFVLKENVHAIDGVAFVESGCATIIISAIVKASWLEKKPVIAANSVDGLFLGAAASYGRSHRDIAESVVGMIYNTLDCRVPLANQPVIVLPSNRFFIVNEAVLQQMGDVSDLVMRLRQEGVDVVRLWPMPPEVLEI
ncbi:MAG: putative tryptophan/tyrosine transport system substrate-binding protein [Candidatus Dependentiae bacterium]|nr:putative tryptophan/tyrosine transport system substrate-binding protein [Candidatus Dependentiae bacterium]